MSASSQIHVTPAMLDRYLHRTLPTVEHKQARAHLDACEPCWRSWNRHRWDAAQNHPIYPQLVDFLGPDFRPYFDSSRALAAEWEAANPRTDAEIAHFFRTSVSYLYNLTIWEASGNRPNYVADAHEALARHDARIILDYGCGIGSDTIPLRNNGYQVSGCDYHSPSTRFLSRRCNTIPVVEPGCLDSAGTADTLWIIDTIDHLKDIETSLGGLLPTVNLMVTENLATSRQHGQQRFHHRRSFDELATVFAGHGLIPDITMRCNSVTIWTRGGPVGPAPVAGLAGHSHGQHPSGLVERTPQLERLAERGQQQDRPARADL